MSTQRIEHLKDLGLQEIKFNINDKIGEIEPIIGKQGDYKTRGLLIQLLHNNTEIDTTGIECEFYATPKDGKVYFVLADEVDVTKGKYEVLYPTSIMQPGIVEAEIRFVKGEQILSTTKFDIYMHETMVTDDILNGTDERPLINVLIEAAKNEEIRIRNEEERIAAENKRIQAENTRIENENERKNNEQIRQQEEDERQQNEITRQTNEQTRQQNEQIRQEAENERIQAENVRQSNENIRESNEEIRIRNEEIREANEAIRKANNEIVEGWIANPEQFNGKSLEFHWSGTKLGVRLEGETEYQYVDLKGEKGDRGPQGPQGERGKGLEFNWDGTKLGVRVEGESEYQYVDLQGPKGEKGSLDDLTKDHVIEALGYTPINANVFPGIIVMWSGNIEDLPDGWVLCDGRNGTPDLRDRFILGADGTDIGDTGGSHTKTIAIDNLPPHSHTFTTNNDGAHRHVGRSKAFSMPENPNGWHVLRRAVSEDSYDGTSNIIHSNDGNHTHSGTTDTTGKGKAIDIRPKYYKLAFIMYKG